MRKLIIKLENELYYQACLCGQLLLLWPSVPQYEHFFGLFRIESSISWIKLDLISLGNIVETVHWNHLFHGIN